MDNKLSKVLITIIAVIIFIVLFAIIVGVRGDAGESGPGMFGLIVVAALIGALSAIWKNKDDKNYTNDLTKK